jgi:amidase
MWPPIIYLLNGQYRYYTRRPQLRGHDTPGYLSGVPLTATDTADAVRRGDLSAVAAVTASLDRIAEHDAALGAFQVVRAERALAEAAHVDGRDDRASLPLAGVPIAVKDNVPVTGEPMRIGSAATGADAKAADHEVVRRMRAAGAVVVGLTRAPELCVFAATDSVFGVTRNPWDPARTAGGSSGGSAASVAAGLVPAAHGNDGMGSIRIPAACCGLVGIKPGLGTVPAGLGNGSWFDMAENGPLTTSVGDAALLLSVLAARPELAALTEPDAPLRVAVSVKAPAPLTPVDPQFAAAVLATGELLAGAGHRVREAEPTYPTGTAIAALARWFAGAEMDARLVADRSKLERRVARHATAGRLALRTGMVRPAGRENWRRKAERFLADYDVLVTPGLAQLPIAADRWGERGWLANLLANARYAPFAAPWNLAGWPAMVIPAGIHETGMPMSVQLVGRAGSEALLLSVAAQLERLRPWPRTAPGYP